MVSSTLTPEARCKNKPENRMTVERLQTEGELLDVDYGATGQLPEAFHAPVEYTILASAMDPFDRMEMAFHRLGDHFLADTERIHDNCTVVQGYGLTPALKPMAQVWSAIDGAGHVVPAKGALEAIVDLCQMDAATQARVRAQVDAMARDGLRVLGVAMRVGVADVLTYLVDMKSLNQPELPL